MTDPAPELTPSARLAELIQQLLDLNAPGSLTVGKALIYHNELWDALERLTELSNLSCEEQKLVSQISDAVRHSVVRGVQQAKSGLAASLTYTLATAGFSK